MTTTIKDILLQYRAELRHGLNSLNVGITAEQQAEQALQTYIDSKVKEARIDELERYFVDTENSDYATQRINELERTV